MRELGSEFPEGWCENLQAVGCKFPAPVLDAETRDMMGLLDGCKTQLRYRGGGMAPDVPYGFDYPACEIVTTARGFDIRNPDFLEQFQIIEDEFIAALSERFTKAK
jgi:hypothetical protein